jgi:hypothetical protein
MRWRAIEVEVIFFDVFAVVAFAVGEPEEPFFENLVFPVPESECKTEPLLLVADAPQTHLAPAIGTRTGLIVGEEIPGIPVVAVILPNGSPLSLGQIRTPFFPKLFLLTSFFEPDLFSSIHRAPFSRLSID